MRIICTQGAGIYYAVDEKDGIIFIDEIVALLIVRGRSPTVLNSRGSLGSSNAVDAP